jgi:hypothetical protein
MGAEVAVAALLMGAAAGANAYNTNRTLKKQDNAAAEALRKQQQMQREANAKVAQTITAQAGSTPEAERARNESEMLAAIQGAQAKARRNLQTPGAASADYRMAANDAGAGAQDYAQQVAGLLSVIDAAGQQRQREGFAFGDLATEVDLVGRRSRGQGHVDDLKVRSIRRNPWIDAAASAASGYASGMTGGAG